MYTWYESTRDAYKDKTVPVQRSIYYFVSCRRSPGQNAPPTPRFTHEQQVETHHSFNKKKGLRTSPYSGRMSKSRQVSYRWVAWSCPSGFSPPWFLGAGTASPRARPCSPASVASPKTRTTKNKQAQNHTSTVKEKIRAGVTIAGAQQYARETRTNSTLLVPQECVGFNSDSKTLHEAHAFHWYLVCGWYQAPLSACFVS